MKVLLMYPDRDSPPHHLRREEFYGNRGVNNQPQRPPHTEAMIQDLELNTLLNGMAGNDEFLFEVAENAVLSGFGNDAATILYRQTVLKDCLKNPAVVRQLYNLTVEAIEETRKQWWGLTSRFASSVLHSSIDLLEFSLVVLKKLRTIAEEQTGQFESKAFTTLFAMFQMELSDDYLATVQNHLAELKFRKGVLLSAELGKWNESTNLLLRKIPYKRQNWLMRIRGSESYGHTFHLDPHDEAGPRILSDMRQLGISRVVMALAESGDHVLSFFKTLRTELAFYVGCLNLHSRLAAKGEPLCFPAPKPTGERKHTFSGLYDVCLSLHIEPRVVGNAADANGKSLIIATGANQGGKSTFLRSVGLAQLMMQCGMFVGAETFEAGLCPALFTHYKRQEDATMKSGKLDEELARMSEIVDRIAPNAILLFNESFAATNEREGSEIAKQIVCALLEKSIKIFFVTHLYEFARGLFERQIDEAMFLRAERKADGTRTFRLVEGEALDTSYAEDLYRQIFESDRQSKNAQSNDASPDIVGQAVSLDQTRSGDDSVEHSLVRRSLDRDGS